MKPPMFALACVALTGCGLLSTSNGGTSGGNGVCHSAGESCASSADCCSGFACGGVTCIFTGGNGNNNGSSSGNGNGSTGAASGGGTSGNGTSGGSASTSGGTHGGSTGAHTTGASGASGTTGQAGTSGSGTSGNGSASGTSGGSTGVGASGGNSNGGTSGAGSQYAAGWPKWHYDNANSGRSPFDTSGLKGNIAWQFSIGVPAAGTTFINSPVVSTVSGVAAPPPYVVYELNMAGTFYALSNAGTQLWTQTLSAPSGDPHPSTPAVLADGTLIVPSGSDGTAPNIYALSDTGSVLFDEPFGADGFDACPLVGPDGTVYLADDDGPSATCGVAGGGADPYSALAFSVNGTAVSQIGGLALPLTLESERFGIALGSDGTSYWGNNGQFFAINPPAAGFGLAAAWPACGVTVEPNTNGPMSDVALDEAINDNLYAYTAWAVFGTTTVQGSLAALNPATGAQKWIFNTPVVTVSGAASTLPSIAGNAAPAIGADGTVYFGNGDGLYAINGATGAERWLFACADVTSSPAIGADGTIFFGCGDGSFNAVTPAGTLRFKIVAGGPISSSPAIAPDGTVIFVADDGFVYAID